MNIVKIRRNIIILTGMLMMNSIYRCWALFNEIDYINFSSYLIINLIWIDSVRRIVAPLVDAYDNELKKNEP